MNLLKSMKFKKGKNIYLKRKNDKIIITNEGVNDGYIIFSHIFFNKNNRNVRFFIDGSIKNGEAPEIKVLNRKRKVIKSIKFNSDTYIDSLARAFVVSIRVKAQSEVILKNFYVDFYDNYTNELKSYFKNDILLITPGYPSLNNKYFFGFVHTRVREYKKANINVDVVSANDSNETSFYNFENINVCETSYFNLRNILQKKRYKKIIVHFFIEPVAQILDATNTNDTDIYLFFHGTDALYRDINILTSKYFEKVPSNDTYKKMFDVKDKILNRYNEMPNVKFIFGSEWAKTRSEEQNNIKYNNYDIIPTYITEDIFQYKEKSPKLRKKVLILRKFDNISTYSIDINVRTILELSRRKIFKDLEFNIYGDGDYHSELLSPIKNFDNVHIFKKFLTHNEISKVHKENGIGLFATRYETMGVSAAEAAMSGLVVVSSDVAAVPQVIDRKFNTLAPVEDYKKMADIIEKLYYDEKLYKETSQKMHEDISNKFGYDQTIKKEIKLLNTKLGRIKYNFKNIEKTILTIGIASYNVENFLENIVTTLINSRVAEKLEILIVNDGSKDKTATIAKKLEGLTKVKDKSIVKLIDKENGGHGSAINKAIELANGKYFKLMDGDDYFDTHALESLVDKLEKDDTDIILNNYVEDLSSFYKFNPVRHYEFMIPGKEYNIEDLCYNNYGFGKWGPLLSTSTFKTEMLKSTNFKITEKCFYVDMELNALAFSYAKTIKYYPLDLYIYYLGRIGQSVSRDSFKKNYKHHETVILRIIKDIYYKLEISDLKKEYLKHRIIVPLILTQYIITTEYFKTGKQFREFDKKLKKYSEFYNNPEVCKKRIKFHRFTNGLFINSFIFLINIRNLVSNYLRRI